MDELKPQKPMNEADFMIWFRSVSDHFILDENRQIRDREHGRCPICYYHYELTGELKPNAAAIELAKKHLIEPYTALTIMRAADGIHYLSETTQRMRLFMEQAVGRVV